VFQLAGFAGAHDGRALRWVEVIEIAHDRLPALRRRHASSARVNPFDGRNAKNTTRPYATEIAVVNPVAFTHPSESA
jgi:hypothetical protein